MAKASSRRKSEAPVGDPSDPRGFEVLIRRYVEWRRVHHASDRTLKTIDSGLRLFARWAVERGMQQPAEVTRAVVERYQAWLFHVRQDNGKPYGWATQSLRLTILRVFFHWLAQERYLLASPAATLVLPRKPPRLPVEGFSIAEVEQVLSTPDVTKPLGLRDRVLLEVLYATGVRRAELAGLDLYDVEMERGYLVVRSGKGGRDRVVPLGERATAWVRRYVEEVRPQLVARPDETALFLSATGGRFDLLSLGQVVKRVLEASGVRPRKGACHLFRHTMATLMLEGGADVRFVQEMLGHVKIDTTVIYTRVTIEKLAQVHATTHPGARLLPDDGAHATTKEELLDALAREVIDEDGDANESGDGER